VTASEHGVPTTVDWPAGIRRERRYEAVLVAAELVALAGYVLIRRDPATVPGYAWAIQAALVVLFLWTQGVNLRGLVGLPRGAEEYRLRSAIRQHVDPGDGLRDATDAYAERRAGTWYFFLLILWLPQLVHGRWSHAAAAIPGAVLLLSGVAGTILWYRRLAAACRRWLADPPGRSPRPLYSAPPDQKPWTVAPRQAVLLLASVVATAALLAAAAQLGR
jgi:hypothetical protein